MNRSTTIRRLIGVAIALGPTAAVAVGQFPDLIVSEIELNPPNPAPGQDISVVVHARNVSSWGTGGQGPIYTYLYFDSAVLPQACAFDDSELLNIDFPGESERLFTFTVRYATAGPKRMWAWIDGCEPQVDEIDDNNNWLSQDLTVGIGDLRISSITPSIADPVPGQQFYVDVGVQNVGPAIVDQIWRVGVKYQSPEPTSCAFDAQLGPFQGFPANSTVSYRFGPVSYPADGTYPVWAWVDCENNVTESNETNNKLFGQIVVGQPDLIVDSIVPSVSTPSMNQAFTALVTIRNAGSRDAGSFTVSVVPDSPVDPGETACTSPTSLVVPFLTAGGVTAIPFSVTYAAAQPHRLWAIADSCHTVAEAREDNNSRSLDLNVGSGGGLSDLVVESIHVQEIPSPIWGPVATFDVTVRNVGSLNAPPCRVGDFELTNFPGPFPGVIVIGSPGPNNGGGAVVIDTWVSCEWRTREAPALAPGAAVTVQFWRHFPQSGHDRFSASADACGTPPTYGVIENSETNNTLTIEFDIVACGFDADLDGVCDDADLCPNDFDPLNNDSDNDGLGDVCDPDDDNDGYPDAEDCEPRNPFIHPGAVEICNDGIDNNCDGRIDEGAQTLYRDADGDGYGNPNETVSDCSRAGYVTIAGDCDDSNPLIHPGANGRCDDGVDNDCDGTIDNERTIWGRDADGDGFANPGDVIVDEGACDGQPAGYVLVTARPDPDDGNFFNPEPVRPEPPSVRFSVPPDVEPPPQTLALVRHGPESFTYDITVEYGPDSEGFPPLESWLTLDAPSGAAVGGRAEIRLTAAVEHFRADYPATLHISLNDQAAFDVPVVRSIRNPQLIVRHRGQGDGSLRIVPFGARGPVFAFDTTLGVTEATFSFDDGESVSLAAQTHGNCSRLVGFFDADGNALDIEYSYNVDADGNEIPGPADPIGGGPGTSTVSVAHVQMDGDQEVTVQFALSGLACTTCGLTMLSVSATLMLSCRRRRS